jgi:hypothetical protein
MPDKRCQAEQNVVVFPTTIATINDASGLEARYLLQRTER